MNKSGQDCPLPFVARKLRIEFAATIYHLMDRRDRWDPNFPDDAYRHRNYLFIRTDPFVNRRSVSPYSGRSFFILSGSLNIGLFKCILFMRVRCLGGGLRSL